MSASQIVLPADEAVAAATGFEVERRETVRKTGLSVVERLHVTGGPQATVVLKTTVPQVRHESAVHGFASGLEISAARLMASDSNAPFPWLVQEDLGAGEVSGEPQLEDIAAALEMLAEFHVKSMTAVALSDVPDRSLPWLVKNIDQVQPMVLQAVGDEPDPILKEFADERSSVHFAAGLRRLAEIMSRLPVTVVHGDFDPGNLVFSRGRWRAIDWGLSHRNVPFVDVSHMLGHVPSKEQIPLVQRYLDAAARLGADLQADYEAWELYQHGNAAHDAFFTWWHSLCITRLGIPRENYAERLTERFMAIRNKSPELESFFNAKVCEPPRTAELEDAAQHEGEDS